MNVFLKQASNTGVISNIKGDILFTMVIYKRNFWGSSKCTQNIKIKESLFTRCTMPGNEPGTSVIRVFGVPALVRYIEAEFKKLLLTFSQNKYFLESIIYIIIKL